MTNLYSLAPATMPTKSYCFIKDINILDFIFIPYNLKLFPGSCHCWIFDFISIAVNISHSPMDQEKINILRH
ncbi:unnamed protein product [Moneuplotes crassus]|uniref:Uncharacterized protein n=1 Tax=Euplotes crassus TaxID=5936 RepID=A0AAD1XP24_EUPCR|nr:unnamed protein product [Moneuplotes crassus]